MSETLHGNYQSMVYSENRVHGRHFSVHVASETKNAHKEWISFFERLGHVEVGDQGDADYRLVFCPVKSRIKTDVDEALEKIPEGKPVILVVMHHTFDPHTTIMESRLQVTCPDVRLTVDSLFYEGRLLTSNINHIAKNQIQNCLGVPASELTLLNQAKDYVQDHWKLIGGLFAITVVVIVVIIVVSATAKG